MTTKTVRRPSPAKLERRRKKNNSNDSLPQAFAKDKRCLAPRRTALQEALRGRSSAGR